MGTGSSDDNVTKDSNRFVEHFVWRNMHKAQRRQCRGKGEEFEAGEIAKMLTAWPEIVVWNEKLALVLKIFS